MKKYDIIIIGAGPAGLLIGKELSKKYSILIIEKNKIGITNKNWLTYKDRWENENFPKSFIENEFKEWHVQYNQNGLKNEFIIKDDFVCFNENKFLIYLSKIIKKNKGKILDKTSFDSYIRKNNKIIINNKYESKLLIDCSGINSKIIKDFNLIKTPIYINCYAYIAEFDFIKNKNFYCFIKDNTLDYSVFGLTKIAPKLAQLQYYKYSNKELNLNCYKKDMLKAQKLFNIKKHKIKELKIATYPTGDLKKRSLDNIILFGDSGFYSPSINGMGFNEILKQYHRVSNHIINCFDSNKFSEKDLELPKNIGSDINNLFFKIFGLIFNDLPQDILFKFFNIINKLNNDEIKKLMRNNITDKEIMKIFIKFKNEIGLINLISILKKSHILKIIKISLKLEKNILTKEVHNLINKCHKIRVRDIYYNDKNDCINKKYNK